jgi:hypothetical protein
MKLTKDDTVLYADLRDREPLADKLPEACEAARARRCEYVEVYRGDRWIATFRSTSEHVKGATS